jgi:LCP family protein required for cell wall assembly
MAVIIPAAAWAESLGSLVIVTQAPDAVVTDSDPPPVNPDDVSDNPLGALTDVFRGPDSFSLLLIGTDSYGSQISGRSDSMILCKLNRKTGKVMIVSFMRDLYVAIPGRGSTRLNAAFVYGGAALLRETLSNQFGVAADAFIAVNFTVMVDLMDRLGGVDVTITRAEMTQINYWARVYYRRSGLNTSAYGPLNTYGDVHLDGAQALAFSRIRNIDSDYQRTRRQRDVVAAAFSRATELNAAQLALLVAENIGKVKTDITLADALDLLPLLLSARGWEVETFRIPADRAYASRTISGMAVLVPDLKKNRDLLRDFLGE